MQKKVIIPLLMAGTATLPALADINMGFPKSDTWTQSGATGNENPWSASIGTGDIDTYTNAYGTGEVSTKVELPRGKYRLSFERTQNILVFVDGRQINASDANNTTYVFDVENAGAVAILIKPQTAASTFSFTAKKLELLVNGFDAATALTQLQNQIRQDGFKDVANDDFYATADELRAEKPVLEGLVENYAPGLTYAQAIAEIRSLDNGYLSLEKSLEIYNKYKLYETPNAPLAALNNLADRQKTYNDKVDAENAAWAVYLANVKKYNELKEAQESLVKNDTATLLDLEQLQAEIDAWTVVDPKIKENLILEFGELKDKVAAYGAAIDKVFYAPELRDVALREPIEFTSQEHALRAELENLQSQLQQGESDYEVYYNVNFVLMDKLQEAYEAYLTALDTPERNEDLADAYADVYGDVVANGFGSPEKTILGKDGAKAFVDDTQANNQIENVAGAADYDAKNKCAENIQKAIDSLAAYGEAYQDLVTEQDDNMVAAQIEIKSLKGRLAKFQGYTPNDEFANEYKATLKNAESLLNDFTTFVDGQYKDHVLDLADGTEYAAKLAAINGALGDLGRLAGPVAIINDLKEMLDAAKAKVVQVSSKKELKDLVNVASKFDGTFVALEEAINKISTQEEAYAAVEMQGGVYVEGCLADEILKTVDHATQMTDKFLIAQSTIDAFKNGSEYINGLAQLKELVNGKKIVNADIKYGKPEKTRTGVTVPEVEAAQKAFDYEPYNQAIAAYELALSDAAVAENQLAWQLINALVDELNEAQGFGMMFGYNGKLQMDMRNFALDCTSDNKDYVHNLYTELQAKKAKAEADLVTNIATVTFTEIDKALEKADNKYKTLKNVATPFAPREAANADELYIDVLKAIYVQEDRINELVANQDAFAALTVKVQELEDALAKFREYNNAYSQTPGKEYFDGKINDIQTELNGLAVELTDAVNNEKAVEKEKTFNEQIQAIDDKIVSTWTADITNNDVHNDQLALEKEVRMYIEDLIAMIKADDNKADLDVVNEWLRTLNGLLDNDMVQANITVTNAYGEGESQAQNDAITAEYNRIKNIAVEIYNNYGDELHQAVVKANADTTAHWPMFMIHLDNLYRDGIRSYNYFYYELENQGWREYVSEAIRRHQSLFQYYDKIKALNEAEAAAVAQWNKDNHVITDQEWNVWLGKYVAMADDITRDVRAMMDEMNTLAESYYKENNEAAANAVAEAEAALTAAGIDTAYLDPAKDYLHEAEFEYWRGSKDGADVSLAMDNIADVLDKVIPAIDVQAYAQEAWAEVYTAAQDTIENLRDELNSYEFADAKVKADQTKIFNQNVNDALALNNKATKQQGLVNFYKSYCEQLQGYLDNMAAAVAKVKESNDLNVENQNIYNDFDTWYNGVGADLDALREYCDAMAGCYGKQGMVDALEGQLAALKQFVETHKATLTNEDIPGRMAEFDAAVNAAYAEAADAERVYLFRKLDETKVAYNDAYQKHATLPAGYTYEGVNADIREIDGGVAALEFNADDKDAFKTAAVNYEKELADIYNMLQSSWTANPTDAVLAGLEAQYTTISATIEAGKNYLANCMDEVKAQYPDAYKSLEDALNAERAAWLGEGAYVLDREPFHKSALDKIQNAVNDLAAEISAAEQRAQAEAEKIRVSEARYEVLKAQYDGLVKDFEQAKATVEGYGNGISEGMANDANNIQRMLDTALKNLNTARASHSLTASSQLTNGNAIDTAIDAYVLKGARTLSSMELDKATKAGNDARGKLTSMSIVPAVREELQKEYSTANSKLQALLNEQSRANVDRSTAIAEEARALVETFNSIAERAQENSFILGDVNMDGEPEPNAVDVQTLITLIGEGETYEDLYAADPRQACAADVATNKVLDIADVTALIQMIIGDQPQVLKVKAHMQAVTGDDHLNIALMGEEDGVRRYALSLTNTTEFIGAQFDIKASGNARIVGMSPAERTAGHEVYMFENLDGARAVMASMENAVFAGNDGIVMYVDVEGKGELTVSEAIFSDKDNVAHRLDKAHTSHIDAIMDGIKDGAARIYDAAGRAYNSLQKGINIIRHKDGKVTKEMHK